MIRNISRFVVPTHTVLRIAYSIAIATLSDRFKTLAPVFQPREAKSKPCTRFFPRFRNWFMTLFAPVVIGRSVCFGIDFYPVI